MQTTLERSSRFLDRPIGLFPRLLLVLSALLLLLVYLLPLWRVGIAFAPDRRLDVEVRAQRWIVEGLPPAPEGEELDALAPADLEPQAAWPNWFPFAVGALVLLGLRAAVVGKVGSVLDVAVLGGYFVLFALWTFGGQAARYGLNIFPGGQLLVEPLGGPVFGSRSFGDVQVDSRPGSGTYVMLGILLLLLTAFFGAWREGRTQERAEAGGIG